MFDSYLQKRIREWVVESGLDLSTIPENLEGLDTNTRATLKSLELGDLKALSDKIGKPQDNSTYQDLEARWNEARAIRRAVLKGVVLQRQSFGFPRVLEGLYRELRTSNDESNDLVIDDLARVGLGLLLGDCYEEVGFIERQCGSRSWGWSVSGPSRAFDYCLLDLIDREPLKRRGLWIKFWELKQDGGSFIRLYDKGTPIQNWYIWAKLLGLIFLIKMLILVVVGVGLMIALAPRI